MTLSSGARLGPYEIVGFIGAGAMGEVYRARDTRLGRDVAIKVLAPSRAADEASMARFEREARAVAALNHSNIIALFDVGLEGSTAYVVTELVDGVTLRHRLNDGPLPIRKAVDYARQIAGALASAHERGIVHRDLKPENVIVTGAGQIKVLDFGLAHITTPPTSVPPDETTIRSAPGMIVGTIGYMSPEQARASQVDHRSDIFALGAVLYEMITGRRVFAGETPADTLAAVLHADPPPLTVVAGRPQGLERIVRRCLEKSPDERFQSASDLAFALDTTVFDDAPSTPAAPAGRRFPRWTIAAAAAALFAAGAVMGWFYPRGVIDDGTAGRIHFGLAASMTWSDAASISPDGQYVVYTGGHEAGSDGAAMGGAPVSAASGLNPVTGRFWLRRLDSLSPTPLSDTQTAVPLFFWSPDSRRLGYRAGNSLVIRDLPDGEPQVLADLPGAAQGVAWSANDDLIVAMAGGLYHLRASGGQPRLIMRTEPEREIWRGAPAFLPGGDRFLFTVLRNGTGEKALETRVGSLDGRELATIGRGITGAMYADGYLLFGAGGSLYAQRFDPGRLALSGDRILLAQAVAQDWRSGRLAVAVSSTGTLIFRGTTRDEAQFTVVDRAGRTIRTIGAPDSYTNFSLSPDEQRIVAARRDPVSGQVSLWMIDAGRGVTSMLTDRNDTEDADDPTWMPDGQHVAYRHGSKLVTRPASGGAARTLLEQEGYPDDVSRDGRLMLFGSPSGNAFEQWALDVSTPGSTPQPLVRGVTLADESRFSPDGRWVVYHSNETGTAQIYVVPMTPSGQKWQISHNGGVQPRWSRDGNELFYLDPDGVLMSVSIPGGDPARVAAPKALFRTGLVPSDSLDQMQLMTGGFLLRLPRRTGADSAAVQIIVNWKPR